MAIEKPNKKKPGFSLSDTDNFQISNPLNNTQQVIPEKVDEITSPTNLPKKRGRKPGTKLAKSYKFQLVPGAVETQILITLPVDLHEKLKEQSQLLGQTVKEYVSKGLARLVDFNYEKKVLVTSESSAVASVAEYPWTWNELDEEYRTPLVFQTLINTNPDWFSQLKHVTNELLSTITKEQWRSIVIADYNAIKQVPVEHLNFILKSIKDNFNNNNNG